MEFRVIVSTFVESTTEQRFLLKWHWIYRFIQFSWRVINLFITLGIAIHEYRIFVSVMSFIKLLEACALSLP